MRTSVEIIRDMKDVETELSKFEYNAKETQSSWMNCRRHDVGFYIVNVPVELGDKVYSLIGNYYLDKANESRLKIKDLVIELQKLNVE